MNDNYIEFFDPVVSSRVNNSRRGFMPWGRFYGFDTWGSGVISHTDMMKYTDTDNSTENEVAVLVSKHGTVIFTDEDYEVTPLWSGNGGKYQVVVGIYEWANVPSSDGFSGLGTLPVVDSEPEDPTAVTGAAATEFPIGYFEFQVGIGSASEAIWHPYAAPYMARGHSNLLNLAYTDQVNIFERTNIWGYQLLTVADLVTNTDSPDYGGDTQFYTLKVPTEGNVVELDLTDWEEDYGLAISKIELWDMEADTPILQDPVLGTPLVIRVRNIPAGQSVAWAGALEETPTSELATDDHLRLGRYYWESTKNHEFFFVRFETWWQAVGSVDMMYDLMWALTQRVTNNEGQLVNHESRITALEGQQAETLNWVDITPAAGVSTNYTITQMQYAVSDSIAYIRVRLTALAGTRSPLGYMLSTETLPITVPVIAHGAVWDPEGKTYADIKVSSSGVGIHIPGSDAGTTFGSNIDMAFDGYNAQS